MTQQATDDEFLAPDELSDWLKVPVATVYDWNYRRIGPPVYKIGKHVRYRRSDVEHWLRSQRNEQ